MNNAATRQLLQGCLDRSHMVPLLNVRRRMALKLSTFFESIEKDMSSPTKLMIGEHLNGRTTACEAQWDNI